MSSDAPNHLDLLWKEYGAYLGGFDDLMLARWMAQTLGQLEGKVWRLSHPLLGVYRLAVQSAHDRQVWLKRLCSAPRAYNDSPCCRAPMLPLLTREVRESGLLCQHCGETLVPFEELPRLFREAVEPWSKEYGPVHAVAHWETERREGCGNYDQEFEAAASKAEGLLLVLGNTLAPTLLEHFPAVVWEDQDECLEVRPEDVLPGRTGN